MDCVALIMNAICLLSPMELTLRGDVSSQIGGDFTYYIDGHRFGGGTLGRLAIDMPLMKYRGITLVAGLEHTSLLDTEGDRGQERLSLGFVWRPFKIKTH